MASEGTIMKFDAVVVGGGIAGLTAAAYLARAGKSVALFEKEAATGGLVNSFDYRGFTFDGGIRSIENSGIVFPMLRQLGIDMAFTQSRVSVGLETDVLKLKDAGSLKDYHMFLCSKFPGHTREIGRIMAEIEKIMGYMDILYGIDNPVFMDLKGDPAYLRKVLLPWLVKYLFSIGKILRLNEPVDEYIRKFTDHQPLIDIIVQHFFQKTPAFFALSYFSLYLDYHYPKGGTGILTKRIDAYIREHGGVIRTGTVICSVDPERRTVTDDKGGTTAYGGLVWAADLKQLYNAIPPEALRAKRLKKTVLERRETLRPLKGGDSVFTLYLAVNREKEYFEKICSAHFFHTPDMAGLSRAHSDDLDRLLEDPGAFTPAEAKETVKAYLDAFFRLNTYEISFPVLRDPALAPDGKTGIIVSTLFDHRLAAMVREAGWYEEFKDFASDCMVRALEDSVFPGLSADIDARFASTPLSLERISGSTDGAITGWAFTNPRIPVIHKLTKMFSSMKTPLPRICQAGQWSYSPSGLPIAVLTGKLAADRVLKQL